MHYYFVVQPRPLGPHTAKDEQRFKDADTTFKGAMISVLGDSMVDTYVMMSTGKEIWDAVEAKLELLTPVVSCTSWSSFMTTEWLSTIL